MNKLEEKKLAGVNFWSIYAPFENSAKCKRHRGQYILPASKRFFSLCCKRRLNFVCLLWNGKFYHESSGCPFSGNESEWQFLICEFWWNLLSSDIFWYIAVFCRHNIAGINRPKCLTESVVFANPLMTITVPRSR